MSFLEIEIFYELRPWFMVVCLMVTTYYVSMPILSIRHNVPNLSLKYIYDFRLYLYSTDNSICILYFKPNKTELYLIVVSVQLLKISSTFSLSLSCNANLMAYNHFIINKETFHLREKQEFQEWN